MAYPDGQDLTHRCVEHAGFDLNDLAPTMILQMVLNPSQQARELQEALSSVSGISGSSGVNVTSPSSILLGAQAARSGLC